MIEEYKATKSVFSDFNFLVCFLLLVFGIIPGVIYILVKRLSVRNYQVLFYEDKYVERSGIINIHEKDVVFKGVLSVSIYKDLKGRMFKFGNVMADVAGNNNIAIYGIKNPEELKKYLQTKIINPSELKHTITN